MSNHKHLLRFSPEIGLCVLAQGKYVPEDGAIHLQAFGPKVNREYGVAVDISPMALPVEVVEWASRALNQEIGKGPSLATDSFGYHPVLIAVVRKDASFEFVFLLWSCDSSYGHRKVNVPVTADGLDDLFRFILAAGEVK